ncbi:protein CIP2A [Biomphalaria glabrata]|nr:protein CIP2A [Biomphalaria glabrata]
MEPTGCIKEVLLAAIQYRNNNVPSAYLLRQLEALQTISSKSSYIRQLSSLDQYEVVECLTFLVEVIREAHGSVELLKRVVKILLNLSVDEHVRQMLYSTFHLFTPLISVIISYSGCPDDDNILLEALQLFQRITYGHRLDYHNTYTEDLLKLLISQVLEQNEVTISAVVGTLANLCRNNTLVQNSIRNMKPSEYKMLLKTLCRFFDHSNQTLVISSMSVFVSLCLNESEGQKFFFESSNVEQTLQTIFSIIKNSFKTIAWKYAADLLTDLLRHPLMQICIKKFRHLHQCIGDILVNLPAGNEESVSEMFQLLLSLCTVPSIRQCVNAKMFSPLAQGKLSAASLVDITRSPLTPETEALLCCLHWVAQDPSTRNRAPCLALDFLIDSCQDCLCGSDSLYPIHLLIPVFTQLLSRPDQTNFTEKTIRLVKILSVLCSSKQSRELIGNHFQKEIVAYLIEKQLSQRHTAYTATNPLVTEETSARENCDRCVLLIADLTWKLRTCIPELSGYLSNILKEPKLMEIVATGLASANQEEVVMSIRLTCFMMGLDDPMPDVLFCGSVAALNKQRQCVAKRQKLQREHSPSVNVLTERSMNTKENSPNNTELRNPFLKTSLNTDKDETHLENLMRKENILETKEVKSGVVKEVLEHNIKTLQIKEEHLSDLLEAKSLALTQADRCIAQLRASNAFHYAEMKKLQNALTESENKTELVVSQMNEMRLNSEKVNAQFEAQLSLAKEEIEALNKVQDEMAEKSTDLEEQLASSKQEIKTLSNLLQNVQKDFETLSEKHNVSCNVNKQLEEERKALSKQIKEKDGSLQKLNVNIQALQIKFNETEKFRQELEKEKEDIEVYVDKLRNQLSSSENMCRQLQQKLTTLEGINQEQEEKLQQKMEKISELESELEKHNQIVSFISSMQLKKK